MTTYALNLKHRLKRLSTALFLCTFAFGFVTVYAQESQREIVIAVPDAYLRAYDTAAFVDSTVHHLNATVQGYRFRTQTISIADLGTQLALTKPDFLIAPAGLDVFLDKPISNFRLATRKSPLSRDASQAVGSVIVTLKDRTDIQTLSDLNGKTVAGGLPGAINTWLAAMNEIEKAGLDHETLFGKTFHLFDVYPDLVSALWGGEADAVILPTCSLEGVAQTGLISIEDLKIINNKTDRLLACKRSTDLFPDFGIVGFDWTDKETARLATVGILTYHNPTEPSQWVPFVSHDRINELYRTLRIGPFSYLRDNSIRALYQRNPNAFNFAGFVFLLLLVHGLLLQVLVRRKTAALRLALLRQRRAESAAKKQRQQLGHLERRNVVNQMSGMIAHEIKSPVGAICNFTAVLSFLLSDEIKKNSDVQTALTSIDGEAKRIAGIVDRVRSYAKSQKMAHTQCDLVAVSRKAVAAFKLALEGVTIRENYQTIAALVSGDALELELLVLNLLRNASEVKPAAGVRVNRIDLTIGKSEDGRWQIIISDQGEPLTDEAFDRLTQMVESVKPEGLGMGLSIIRGIADSHAARFEFIRNNTVGLSAVVTFTPYRHPGKDAQS